MEKIKISINNGYHIALFDPTHSKQQIPELNTGKSKTPYKYNITSNDRVSYSDLYNTYLFDHIFLQNQLEVNTYCL